ncbi:MAG: alpha/beta hydrolase [Paludibacteraceae bacterium]
MKRICVLTLLICSMLAGKVFSQEEIKLYPNGPEESNELQSAEKWRSTDFLLDISEPRMYSFIVPKEKTVGTAVLICPGGGYSGVSVIKEGEDIAKWFNNLGVSAFVLYYRMPNGHHEIPLKDAQTALSIIDDNARKWNIDRKKIGIMGFSAGGHLASTVGTHFKSDKERPDFMILAYPVISMDKGVTHKGSRDNLLGKNPTDKLVNQYSNELQVTKETPSTFLLHAKDDKTVPVENSKLFYRALLKNNVRAEIVLTQNGGHGFGMQKKGTDSDGWEKKLKEWLVDENLVK